MTPEEFLDEQRIVAMAEEAIEEGICGLCLDEWQLLPPDVISSLSEWAKWRTGEFDEEGDVEKAVEDAEEIIRKHLKDEIQKADLSDILSSVPGYGDVSVLEKRLQFIVYRNAGLAFFGFLQVIARRISKS